jgi:hypothetical protein
MEEHELGKRGKEVRSVRVERTGDADLALIGGYEPHRRRLFNEGLWSPEYLSKEKNLFFPFAAKSERVTGTKVTDHEHKPTIEKFIAVKLHQSGDRMIFEFNKLREAYKRGIGIKPVGYMGELNPDGPRPKYSRGWLYTEILPHSMSLDSLSLTQTPIGEKKSLFTALGRTIARWHFQQNFYHGDLAPRNILFTMKPGHIMFHAVDLEKAMFEAKPSEAHRQKELKMFEYEMWRKVCMENGLKQPTDDYPKINEERKAKIDAETASIMEAFRDGYQKYIEEHKQGRAHK